MNQCQCFSFVQKQKYANHIQIMLMNINEGDCKNWISHCSLTAHNWQKWKRVFLTCPYHKIYRDEAVDLKSYKYTCYKYTMWQKVIFYANINIELLIVCLKEISSNLELHKFITQHSLDTKKTQHYDI